VSRVPACPDCGLSDWIERCPNVSRTRWYIGCTRCQNAKGYDTFADMWAAWCALAERKPPAEPVQPALFGGQP